MHPLKVFYSNHGINQDDVSLKTEIGITTLSSYMSRNTEVKELPVGILVALSEITHSTLDEVYKELIDYEKVSTENKYSGLATFLSKQLLDKVMLSFDKINSLLPDEDPLPPSAYKYREWWSNTDSHSQASSWMNEHFKVTHVAFDSNYVTFEKNLE